MIMARRMQMAWIAESDFSIFFFDISLNKWEYSLTFHPLTRQPSPWIFTKWTCSLSTRWFTDGSEPERCGYFGPISQIGPTRKWQCWPDENRRHAKCPRYGPVWSIIPVIVAAWTLTSGHFASENCRSRHLMSKISQFGHFPDEKSRNQILRFICGWSRDLIELHSKDLR